MRCLLLMDFFALDLLPQGFERVEIAARARARRRASRRAGSGARTSRWRAAVPLRGRCRACGRGWPRQKEYRPSRLPRRGARPGCCNSVSSSAISSLSLSNTGRASGQSKPIRAARFWILSARSRAGRASATPSRTLSAAPLCLGAVATLGRFVFLPGPALCRYRIRFRRRRRHADGAAPSCPRSPRQHLRRRRGPVPRPCARGRRPETEDRRARPLARPCRRARSRRPPHRLPRSCTARSSRNSAPDPTGNRAPGRAAAP